MTPLILDPALTDEDATRLLEIRDSYGPYRFTLGAETRYFRETYAYRGKVFLPGIEFFVEQELYTAAARELHGRDMVVPAIVYANILVPGQQLVLHTDLPEYRGADRRTIPLWLLRAMHRAGLFERWRLHMATAVTYVGGGRGGAFVFYPDGATGPVQSYQPRHNTAMVIDVESVLHGVNIVEGDQAAAQAFRPGVKLEPSGGGGWVVSSADGSRIFAEYAADDLRYSVSWKAYCFSDEAERTAWERHTDDLDLTTIKRILVEKFGRAGRLPGGESPATDEELRALADMANDGTGEV